MDFENLEDVQAVLQGMALMQKQMASGALGYRGGMLQKHTLASSANAMAKPMNEDAFFIDPKLERPIINAVLSPIYSLLNVLPARPSILAEKKVGILTSWGGDATGTQPNYPCDDPETINDDYEACKLKFAFARRSLRSKTGEIDELITKASRGVYDDFYFLGDLRGVSATPMQRLTTGDRDLITAAAVRKQMMFAGRTWQKWMMQQLWAGDTSNNTANGGYKEMLGLNLLINGDYANSSLPLEGSTSQVASCDISSDVKDFTTFGDGFIGGSGSIFRVLQEMEHTLFMRAQQMGLQVEWVITMPSTHWNELIKVVPCEMAGDGCSGGTVSANDGNTGMFNMAMRAEMQRSMQITLNGRTYPVVLDDAIPYIYDGANVVYDADIYMIPLTANGEEVTLLEYKDYSQVTQTLRPVSRANVNLMEGFSDGGRFLFKVQEENFCFEVMGKVEPRLIFRAPHLAGRIQNVKATPLQAKDLFFPAS